MAIHLLLALSQKVAFFVQKAHLFDKQNPAKTIPKFYVFLNSTLSLIVIPLHQGIPLEDNIQNISLLVNPSGRLFSININNRKNITSACSHFFHKGK